MILFKKKETVSKEKEPVLQNKAELQPIGEKISYTEWVHRELNSKIDPIKKEIKELEKSEREVIDDIAIEQKAGNNTAELLIVIRKIRENLVQKEKELVETENKYKIPFDLKILASDLDNLETHNRGVLLYQELGYKFNQIMKLIKEIEVTLGQESSSLGIFKSIMMNSIIPNLNDELPKIHKWDRAELEQKIKQRMEELDKKKEKSSIVEEKYKNLFIKT